MRRRDASTILAGMALTDRLPDLDRDWRAVAAGLGAAPTLVAVGLLAGWAQGGLLPGDCRGLACVYLQVLLLYGAALLGLWILVATLTALARQRWPRSTTRSTVLRALALVSYGPVVWLLGTLADVW